MRITHLLLLSTLSLQTIPAAQAETELSPSPRPADDRPNIILIVADDLGYGDLSCYGSRDYPTPNIDRLAERGLRFTDFYANGYVCSPTRAALLTGQYPQRAGVSTVIKARGKRLGGLKQSKLTFAELLKTQGYATAIFGKWHLGYQPEYNPIHYGFDQFRGFVAGNIDFQIKIDQTGVEDWWQQDELKFEEGYVTDVITEHGVDFIERNKDHPFLLYLPHQTPHYPWQGRNDPPLYIPGKGVRWNKMPRDGDRKRAYREMLQAMDEGVGAIMKAVEEAGIAENTLIFFTSDNGPVAPGSTGPLRGQKARAWEGGIRVPGIAYWPGTIAAGGLSHTPAITMDLLPTFAEISGASLPENHVIDGMSLFSYLTEGVPLKERTLFWNFNESAYAVRQGDYKFVISREGEKGLFNLKEDISEENNLAAEYPERFQKLQADLATWMESLK